jgi:hypothetical protein
MTTKTIEQPTFSNGSIVSFEKNGLKKLQTKLSQFNIILSPQEIASHIEKQSQGATSGSDFVVGFNWVAELYDFAIYLNIHYVGKSYESVEIISEFNKYSISTKPVAAQFRRVTVYNFSY